VGFSCSQIASTVTAGGRPAVPPLEVLPGPDKPDPASYDAFCQLMRWGLGASRPQCLALHPRAVNRS
jgi:hypothetical protein